MADAHAAEAGAGALAALRSRGADRFDPVRFRFLEALARRAATHDGAARRVLDDKLARLVSAYEAEAASAVEPGRRIEPEPPRVGVLAALAELLDRRRPTATAPAAAPASAAEAAADAPAEMPALQYLRRTWARLSAEQRLAQSRAALPGNAGPLNSHHLVHRALTLMRDVSPAYLERFVAHADALLWLEETAGLPSVEKTPRPEKTDKRPARGRG